MSITELKPAINFGIHDSSSFLAATLVHGMQLRNVTVSQNAATGKGKPQIFNLEMVISKNNEPTNIYGEITISDFLVGLKNSQEMNRNLHRLG